ncbi:putative glycosyltransferase 4 [Panicum miliaceum]|uniref:Glycosyltransferase 4 n=1 Tax=Panicum miliaceum TaxID=4540 RepID=A0A3L6TGZ9_PANMI|nr:putative glycosyltransferase 4 [Panicum miliaceum]
MSEQAVAADRRGWQHRPFRLLVVLVLLFLGAPGAIFFFMSTGLARLPRIRLEYDGCHAHSSARTDQPPPSPSPSPSPQDLGADNGVEEQRAPPPLRQLTDPPHSLGPVAPDYDERRAQWRRDNPRFPAFVAPGRPRVLVVTGSSPRRCSAPDGDHLLLRAFKNKVDYCRVHDFDIFYSTAVLDTELTGFWTKLPLLRSLMLAHPETEFLWWMDSDLMLTDMLFEPPHNLVIHNCRWSLDLLDAWARMGPRGPVREMYGKLIAETLSDRGPYEACDQSALVYLLVTERGRWGDKTFLESSYSRLLGGDRGQPCGRDDSSYDAARCRCGMERALNFADDQILNLYGFEHESLNTTAVRRVRNDTGGPLDADDVELGRLLHPTFRAANL